MADDAPRSTRTPSWAGSVGWWLVAWLAVSVAIVGSALLAALLGMGLTTRPAAPGGGAVADGEAMARMSAAMLPFTVGIGAAAALLAGLPFQAIALHLRRRGEGSGVFASVALLTCLSAMLTFAAFYWPYAVYAEMLRPTTLLLTAMLAGFYLIHVLILLVARALAARRSPATPT